MFYQQLIKSLYSVNTADISSPSLGALWGDIRVAGGAVRFSRACTCWLRQILPLARQHSVVLETLLQRRYPVRLNERMMEERSREHLDTGV